MNIDINNLNAGEINIDDLPKLIGLRPQLAGLYGAIYGIDRHIRLIILDALKLLDDPEKYAIKTSITDQCYQVLLWHKDIQATVGFVYPFTDLIELCQKGQDCLSTTITTKTTDIIKRFEKNKTLNKSITNWV